MLRSFRKYNEFIEHSTLLPGYKRLIMPDPHNVEYPSSCSQW